MEESDGNVSLKQILEKIAYMEDKIDEHFESLSSEIARLSAEFKAEVENIKTTVKDIEKSLQSAWDNIKE